MGMGSLQIGGSSSSTAYRRLVSQQLTRPRIQQTLSATGFSRHIYTTPAFPRIRHTDWNHQSSLRCRPPPAFSQEQRRYIEKNHKTETDHIENSNGPESVSAAENKDTPAPTREQLRVYGLQCAVPMVGFGFIDNIIMILAGDAIDTTLGVTFGFATITAAAMGQICSDASGVAFGSVVDSAFAKLGVPVSDMTSDQIRLPHVRMRRTISMTVGVLSGCLLGMAVSLPFMDLDKANRLKQQKELKTIFATLAEEGSALLGVQQCTLYIVDKDQKHVWTAARNVSSVCGEETRQKCKQLIQKSGVEGRVSSKVVMDCLLEMGHKMDVISKHLPATVKMPGANEEYFGSIDLTEALSLLDSLCRHDEARIFPTVGGCKWWVMNKKKLLNVDDIRKDERFKNSTLVKSAERDEGILAKNATRGESILIGPVMGGDNNGEVIGLVEMVNKRDREKNGELCGFDTEDEKLVKLLCVHCSMFIEAVEGDD